MEEQPLCVQSFAVELDDESPFVPMQERMNTVAGAPNRIDVTYLHPEEPLQLVHKDQLDARLAQAKQVEELPLCEESYALELDDETSFVPMQKIINTIVGVPNRTSATILDLREPLQLTHEDQLDTRLTRAEQVEELPLCEESFALELDDESPFVPMQTDMMVGVPNKINEPILPLQEPLHEDQHDARLTQAKQAVEQPLCKMLADLSLLALDSSCLQVEYLNRVEQCFLRFRHFSFEQLSDINSSRCSPLENNAWHFSLSQYTKSQQTVKVDRKICGSILPCSESPLNQLEYKRLLDQPDVWNTFLFSKPFFLICGADLSPQINRTGSKAGSPDDSAMMTNTCADTDRTGLKESLFQNPFSECQLESDIANPSTNVSTCSCSNNLADSVHDTSNNYLQKDSVHQRNVSEISNVISSLNSTCISNIKVQENGGSISLPRYMTCKSYAYDTNKKISNEYTNEGAEANELSLIQPSPLELVFGDDTATDEDAEACASSLIQPSPLELVFDNDTATDEDAEACASSLIQPSPLELVFSDDTATDVGNTTKDIDDCEANEICPLQSHQTHDKKMEPFDGEKGTSGESNAFLNEGEIVYDLNVLQPVTNESVSHDVIGTNVKNDAKDIDDNVASKISPLRTHQISDKIAIQPHGGTSSCSVTPDREVKLSVDSGGSISKNKKLCEPRHSSVNSKVAKQSKELSASASKILHMMFPKGFTVPSKQELVKKFRRFRLVDNLNTKTFFYGRSAQVVFFDPADAEVAYRYARRKHLFGQTNVRYWLDPFEQERNGTVSQAANIATSCLKSSNRPDYEERRKRQRVRFLIDPFEQERKGTVSQAASIAKSCLKSLNRPDYEERKKRQRVRFLIETSM